MLELDMNQFKVSFQFCLLIRTKTLICFFGKTCHYLDIFGCIIFLDGYLCTNSRQIFPWVICYLNSLNCRFILPTWLILFNFQIQIYICFLHIYINLKFTFVTFRHSYFLWVNDSWIIVQQWNVEGYHTQRDLSTFDILDSILHRENSLNLQYLDNSV